MEIGIIIFGVIVLMIFVNVAAIWLTRKGLTKDENNNMIPDILEDKFEHFKKDVAFRVDRVGKEIKDVGKAIKEVGNQLGDVPKAVASKTRKAKKSE